MCNGTIMDKLISFSLPLMVSGILQLMFNAVDIIVVGRFSGSQALAAVGSTTALINVFINLFMGISLGANVLAARYYAAGRDREMSETVHTSIMLALISGVVMAFVGVFFAKGALELMDTPADVIDQSALYMRIYFMGMPFFMLYNYGAAALRARLRGLHGHAHEVLLRAHCGGAATIRTGLRGRAFLRAGAVAGAAGLDAGEGDLALAAEGRVFKADLDLADNVLALARPSSAAGG